MPYPPERRVFMQWLAAAAAATALPLHAAGKIRPDARSALIVVDVQNCFAPGGTLPVTKGDEVVLGGGILGKVSKLGETYMHVEVASGVEIQVQRNAVVQVLPKGTVK